MGTLGGAAVAFAVSLALAPVVLAGLRRAKMLDVPNPRSSHGQATPRSGGAAPALACVVAAALSSRLTGNGRTALLVVSVGFGVIGLADDVRPRPALLRLLGQAAVAAVSLIWLLSGTGGGWPVVLATGGAIAVWEVGFVNVFNFMDGINGLAATQVVLAGACWWLIAGREHVPELAAAGAIAAGAAAAFAPFNVPRARMFLGDVGSYFLGGWLAATAVIGLQAGIAPEAVLAPLALFAADAGSTLVRRARRHQPVMQAHREHVYQRLAATGWSHTQTTLLLGLLMAAVSALGSLSLAEGGPELRVVGDATAALLLSGYLVLPEWLASTRLSGSGAVAQP